MCALNREVNISDGISEGHWFQRVNSVFSAPCDGLASFPGGEAMKTDLSATADEQTIRVDVLFVNFTILHLLKSSGKHKTFQIKKSPELFRV